MIEERFIDYLLIVFGLYSVVMFKKIGVKNIEQQKKVNKILRIGPEKKYFGKYAIKMEQILTLIVGTVFIIIGTIRLLS